MHLLNLRGDHKKNLLSKCHFSFKRKEGVQIPIQMLMSACVENNQRKNYFCNYHLEFNQLSEKNILQRLSTAFLKSIRDHLTHNVRVLNEITPSSMYLIPLPQ